MSSMLLSPAKRSLLSLLVKKHGISRSDAPTISRRISSGPGRLSFAQERIWLYEQLDPGTCAYLVPMATRIKGAFHLNALCTALREIVRRHEILRTAFTVIDGEPVQIAAAPADFHLKIIDLSNCSRREQDARILQFAEADRRRPFDLRQAPLIRAALLGLDKDEFVLFLTMHHIVSDGWSLKILLRELALLYSAFSRNEPSPLPELPVQYADFAEWQRNWMKNDTLERQLAYWKRQLADLPELELPTDKIPQETPSACGALESTYLSESLTRQLKSFSQQQGVTLFMTLYAAFQVLLFKYTCQTDIAMGVPIANRNRSEVEELIGFFVNTLVLRTSLLGNPSFTELLIRSREVVLKAYAHQDLPFDKMVHEVRPARRLGHMPLFRVFFALNNTPEHALALPDITLSPLPLHNGIAKFDLEVSLAEANERLRVSIIYKVDLFHARTIQNFLKHFEILLEQILAYPGRSLLDFTLNSDQEVEAAGDETVFPGSDKFSFE